MRLCAQLEADAEFKQVAVSADRWMPLVEVPPSHVVPYVRERAAEGYEIVAMEQTTSSAPLHRHAFRKRTVLVIGRKKRLPPDVAGAEKEGIPVEVLRLADKCVEIPQRGIIRSFNAHVTASIALWEYTRQALG